MMPAELQRPSIKRFLAASLLLGGVSFSSRWTILPFARTNFTFVSASIGVAVAWALLVIWSIARHGKRAFWLLVGAPLVLWWPCMYALLVWSCHHGYECF
jgi:hypothetical protein